MQRFFAVFVVCGWLAGSAVGQVPSGSSSSSGGGVDARAQQSSSSARPGGQPEAGGAAITLETSEPLFYLATALNACGYDADLADSQPVRAEIRADVEAAVAESALTRQSRDKLCLYIEEHRLSDRARELAQYISLALYLHPDLTPTAEETDMPPDALQVVNILPLLRDFAAKASLNAIRAKHRPEYEAITDKIHQPVTKTILATNLYLKVPVSSYDGRRLLILVEPMLAPNAPNARIYAADYVIVTSPTAAGAVKLEEIRHLYLHYQLEPLVYARAQSMMRLTPLLKPVEDAPLEYVYKTDVVALVTECMIKAIEARTMYVGFSPPVKPTGAKVRSDEQRYTEELSAYDRQAETVRRQQVALDMRQGWVLVDYFYQEFQKFEHQPAGLGESMGEMVYGMDVDRVKHSAEQITFLPQGSAEFATRAPRALSPMALAEKLMLQGKPDEAEAIADRALADPEQDHGDAMYVKARAVLMEGDPKESFADFEDVLRTSHTPHLLAWAHVYLGRLYDIKDPPERQHALGEYRAALAVPAIPPDAQAAAQRGLKESFEVPKVVHSEEEELDPSGKAEKEAYKPEEEETPKPAPKPPKD